MFTRISTQAIALILFLAASAVTLFSQTTEFTYQGKLQDGAIAANANYDFEFVLYDSPGGGTQIGTTNSRNNIAVASGIFSVTLDFGAGFPGADRFLEIRVRPAGGPVFTTLAPRQKVNSAPYGIRSQTAGTADTAMNAAQLGGISASQFVQTNDPRLTDARPPAAGSTNYVQNTTTTQASTNFNISGNGTAGGVLSGSIVNASQFNIGGNRVLSATANSNTLVGLGTGNPTGGFGDNTFVGAFSGGVTTSSTGNSFFGQDAGADNQTGNLNTFVGRGSGSGNTTGSNNTLLGAETRALVNNLQFATAIGAGSDVLTSNTVVLGRRNGSDFVFVPGPVSIVGSVNVGSGGISSGGSVRGSEFRIGGRILGSPGGSNDNNTVLGSGSDVAPGGLTFATAIGAGAIATESNSLWLGRSADIVYIPGFLRLSQLGGAGATALCRNNANTIGTCSSSLRYKTNIVRFGLGLSLVRQLQPITFDWKEGGMHDLGLGAEDVAAIEPLLVTYNEKGEVEGVKYDRIAVVLVNAVKEQQFRIERQQKQIDALTAIVCASNATLEICKEQQK
jgi:hypothetical protein